MTGIHVILYEIGFAAETGWKGEGVPPFDYVADMVDNRVGNICAMVNATRPPKFYFTGKTNFRTDIAKHTPYKQRNSFKPYHYYNIKAYIKGKWEWFQEEGFEADDLMALEQTRVNKLLAELSDAARDVIATIISTRDKDLRQVPGWHYGWELGNQPQFGPTLVDELGYIVLEGSPKKLKGTGMLFFYAQCLTGDGVDTIPGLPGCGAVNAFKHLAACSTPDEAYKAVLEAYRALYGASAEEQLLEQGRLLWMTRALDDDGKPVLWELPNVS